MKFIWLVPGSHAWPPATDVPAILFVVCAEFLAQGWLFIKHHKQMNAESNRRHGSDHRRIGATEHNPQSDPPCCEAHVHGVANVAIETHHDQPLRWSDRYRRAASGPPEIPDAAQRNRES